MLLKIGLFNLETGLLENFTSDIVITNLIPHKYSENACSELVDNVLNKLTCNDRELRSLLEEMIGYTFYRSNIYAKSFFLIGILSNNGKSVFLNLLKKLLGDDNFSSLTYEELGDRFKTAEVAGMLANIGDDCSKTFNTNSAIFKKLSTGETITVERKGKDPFKFNNYAKMIFSFNELPRTDDKSNATAKKRMCIIPFNAVFKDTDQDYDPNINDKLQKEECIEYVIKLGIEGLQRLIENKGFTKAKVVEKETSDYETYNNTILQFMKEKEEDISFDIEKFTPTQIYNQYKLWSESNGFDKIVNNTSFGMEMKRLGYENKPYRLDDKLARHYVKSASNK